MSEQQKTDGALLRDMGIDGMKWSEEFCKRFPTVDVSDALGWFCNAIMAGFDEGVRRTEAADCGK